MTTEWIAAEELRLESDAVELINLSLEPFALYRVDFEAKTGGPGFWFADFFNVAGVQNYADNYSSVYPAAEFTAQSGLFMARAEAVCGKVGFRMIEHPLTVRNVRVTKVSKAEALDWMDALYMTLPQIDFSADLTLPKKEGVLKVVALGDSISNDMLNGLGHLLVERKFHPPSPTGSGATGGLEIEMIHSNGPEKSSVNYQPDDVLERFVYRHQPDLFMLSGMSHEPESVRNIIRKVKARCCNVPCIYTEVRVNGDPESEKRLAQTEEFRKAGTKDGFAVIDLTTPYEECIARAAQPADWFRRDGHHVNDRGKQLLGRLFAAVFDV